MFDIFILKKKHFTLWHKVKTALLFFLPFAVLANCILWIFYYQEVRTKENILKLHAISTINMQKIKIGNNFSLITSDLLFFANYNELLDALENPEIHRKHLINDFALFSRGSKIYDQIRLLDTTGMEIIRINFSEEGPVVVPEDHLQFKGERYYFKDTFLLNKGEIFISPFDLNLEHGKIEQPLKPMIRFGTPIFAKNGQERGVIIFNYLGANLIQDVKDVATDSPGQYMLLNSDGYWIIGIDAEDEWGFMYEDRKNHTMRNFFTEAWETIEESESGQFNNADGLFTFSTVYPLVDGWKSSSGSGEPFTPSLNKKEAQEYYWKIVSYFPKALLEAEAIKTLKKYIFISTMMVVLLAMGAWLLALARISRQQAENSLQQSLAELERVNERLKELDQLKSMFIASMSHELRTPLNSIIGFTGIMLQGLAGDINDEQRDQLQRVYRSGKHLLSLITDVIDISKIESDKIVPYPEEFLLADVIEEACDSLKSQMKDKGLALVKNLPQQAIHLKTDRRRLLQCLLNYLSNAIKFSEKGKIEIAAREKDGKVEITVVDTGIGIKEEDMSAIFQSFVRLESPLKVTTSGTGLGLYLTKKLATEVLEGEVSAESTFGKGSVFKLTIPKEIGE